MTANLAAMLFDSDRRYFAAAARERLFLGGAIRWMSGLQHLSAGCLAERTEAVSPSEFAAAAAAAARSVGAPLLRFYELDGAERASRWARQGFAATIELAYVRRPHALGNGRRSGARIRPVMEPRDWLRKERLARALDSLPDGKPAAAAEWTSLERRKSDAGYARFYTLEIEGHVCATFGLADCRPLLRLKNLAVHPQWRQRGLGLAAVEFALAEARDNGFEWLGAFGIDGGAGSRLYAGCGFERVGSQTEWTRAIAPSPPLVAAAEFGARVC